MTNRQGLFSFSTFGKMAKAVMEAFPALPVMSFGTSKEEMAFERTKLALSLLSGSVFEGLEKTYDVNNI